jgi:hypothetical protein
MARVKNWIYEIKIQNIQPKICPICNRKYIPTAKSPDECLICKNGGHLPADLTREKTNLFPES